jgi:hypothetical protein
MGVKLLACFHSVQSLLSSRLLSKNIKIRIYKTQILPVVLFGCKSLSLTLREEHRLRAFENRVLRRIFGPKRDEMIDLRKLHYEELYNLHSSRSIIGMTKSRRMKWARHVARMGETRNAYRILMVKPEGKRPVGRPRRKWVDNVKMDIREIGWAGMNWINQAQGRDQWRALLNTITNLRVP